MVDFLQAFFCSVSPTSFLFSFSYYLHPAHLFCVTTDNPPPMIPRISPPKRQLGSFPTATGQATSSLHGSTPKEQWLNISRGCLSGWSDGRSRGHKILDRMERWQVLASNEVVTRRWWWSDMALGRGHWRAQGGATILQRGEARECSKRRCVR